MSINTCKRQIKVTLQYYVHTGNAPLKCSLTGFSCVCCHWSVHKCTNSAVTEGKAEFFWLPIVFQVQATLHILPGKFSLHQQRGTNDLINAAGVSLHAKTKGKKTASLGGEV